MRIFLGDIWNILYIFNMLSLNVFSELKMLFIIFWFVVEVNFSNVEVFRGTKETEKCLFESL